MAKFAKGILGGFSGLIGTVVGSTWRTLDVMKSRPKKSTKPATALQTDQRLKFTKITSFLADVKDLIQIGYQSNNGVITPMNAALSYNLDNALTGTAPNVTLDYSKVIISAGKLTPSENMLIVPATGALLNVSWDALDGYPDSVVTTRNTDQLMLLVYAPTKNRFLTNMGTATRGSLQLKAKLPQVFVGTPLHCWLFFVTADGKTVSQSVYTGPLTGIA